MIKYDIICMYCPTRSLDVEQTIALFKDTF